MIKQYIRTSRIPNIHDELIISTCILPVESTIVHVTVEYTTHYKIKDILVNTNGIYGNDIINVEYICSVIGRYTNAN